MKKSSRLKFSTAFLFFKKLNVFLLLKYHSSYQLIILALYQQDVSALGKCFDVNFTSRVKQLLNHNASRANELYFFDLEGCLNVDTIIDGIGIH